jgi:hypothetical protein
MRELLKAIICIALVWASIGAAFPLPVHAHILEGKHILYLMLEKMSLPGSSLLHRQVTHYDPDTGEVVAEGRETLRFRMPEQFRSEMEADGLSRIYAASGDRSVIVINNRVIAETDLWTDYCKNIFWYRSLDRLEYFLESVDMDVSVSSLGRFQGQIAFVIGDVYPSESSPQLWVTRETFRPLRWLFQAEDPASGSPALEFRFGEWKQYSGIGFPSRIEFFVDQRLIRSVSVDTATTSPTLTPELFDIDHIQRQFESDGNDAAGDEPDAEIQRRIDDFKRIYE